MSKQKRAKRSLSANECPTAGTSVPCEGVRPHPPKIKRTLLGVFCFSMIWSMESTVQTEFYLKPFFLQHALAADFQSEYPRDGSRKSRHGCHDVQFDFLSLPLHFT